MVPPIKQGISKKKKRTVFYPNFPSATRPVLHGEGLPIPEPPKEYQISSDEDEKEISDSGFPEPCTLKDPDFLANVVSNEPQKFSQNELNDLIRDLDLSKSKAEILASRLQQRNLLERNVNISV